MKHRRGRLSRAAFVSSERGKHVAKTITVDDLNSGKRQPAKLPDGGGITQNNIKHEKPNEKKKNRKKMKMKKLETIDLLSADEGTLIDAHSQLHIEYLLKAEDEDNRNTTEDIVNKHAVIISLLKSKSVSHPVPPNSLDEISKDFVPDNFDISKSDKDDNDVSLNCGDTTSLEILFAGDKDDQGKKYFTIHNSWCGKSIKRDMLIEFNDELALRCRTDIAEVEEVVKNLDDAKRRASDLLVDEPMEVSLAIVPRQWLDIEGKSVDPSDGMPLPIGGDKDNPGVYHIVDHGVVECCAYSPEMFELYLHGKNMTKHVMLAKRDNNKWMASDMPSHVPYVLGKHAIEDGYCPPKNVSALPIKIRRRIPLKYRFWEIDNPEEAIGKQRALYKAICTNRLEIDFDKIYKRDKSVRSRFAVQKQTYSDNEPDAYWIRMNLGGCNELISIKFGENPLTDSEKVVMVRSESRNDSMEIIGELSPSHFMNLTKRSKSCIERLDEGEVEIVKRGQDVMVVEFLGSKLNGLYQIKGKRDDYLFGPATEEQELRKYAASIKFDVKIEKVVKERRLVYGIVLEPSEVDAQRHTIGEEAIERAAHNFLANYNKLTKVGLMHKIFGDIGVELYQSYIALSDFKLGGKKVKKGSWVMVTHITDDKLWKSIKEGKITGYSIGGKAMIA